MKNKTFNTQSEKYGVLKSVCGILLSVLLVSAFVLASVFATNTSVCEAATDFKTVGKSAYMVDYATGTVLYARNENERLPIASMVKIMTSLLTLEAVERGDISLDDDVEISQNSASMGGSQVFLDAGTTHKAGELLKTVIVASANDSCVALAEHISGSVENFVTEMNARAKELGMNDTAFKNCTGLPAAESFSSAKDVSVMFRQLVKHKEYFEYAKIWLEDYKHPDGRTTTITNTNKLVRFYQGCDGGKTGFTSEAKFCLCATAKKSDMRVVAVVIGADSSKIRNAAISSMFDYAFSNFANEIMLKSGENLDVRLAVSGGKSKDIALGVERDVARFVARDDNAKYEIKFDLPSSVKAPVKKGDKVGEAYLLKDGVVIDKVGIVANEDVARLNLFDAIGEIAKNWSTVK